MILSMLAAPFIALIDASLLPVIIITLAMVVTLIVSVMDRASLDLRGAALFHLGSYSRDDRGAFEVLYMNPTTSTRFNEFMPRIIRGLDLRLTGGKGGSDQAGMTAAVYLYRNAFDFNDFGAASAMSWLLFLIVAALTWLTHRAFRRKDD